MRETFASESQRWCVITKDKSLEHKELPNQMRNFYFYFTGNTHNLTENI